MEQRQRIATASQEMRSEQSRSIDGIETEWSLFYHCFWKVKGAGTVPPPDIFPLGENTLTMTERMYISRQDPQIYKKW